MGANPLEEDDGPMLRPEEYTLPGIEALRPPMEPGHIAESVKQAREGNVAASREVLSEFIATVDRNREQTWLGDMPWPCARFVADKLRAVLNGDPNDAAANLGIKSGSAGKPTTGSTTGLKHSHLAVAAFYFLLIRAGVAPKTAKSLMSERAGLGDPLLEEAVREYPGFQYRDRFTVEILVELAAAFRRNIAEVIAVEKLRLS